MNVAPHRLRTPTIELVPSFVVIAVVLIGLSCRPVATFGVLRPAQINAQDFGGTMTVQTFGGPGEAAMAVTRELRRRVGESEGGVVRYVRSGAGLLVHGEVADHTYRERLDRRSKMCSRTGGFGDRMYERSYMCSSYTRTGHAHVAITFYVIATESGEQVMSLTLEDSWHAMTRRDQSLPAKIDGTSMLVKMRQTLIERFAKIVLPWREQVEVRFGRCGRAQVHCEAGIEALRTGRFKRARGAFSAALRQLEKSGGRDRHIAGAFYNLGLAREYSAEFEGAISAIRRASKLDPENDEYRRELRNVRRMRREREELTRQGHGRSSDH